ncbi:MAG: anti-sigma factor family protein [Kiritimatiellia bacterium]
MNRRCRQLRKWMSEFLDGELDQRQRGVFLAHLDQCRACQAELAALRNTVEMVRELDTVEPPADLLQRVRMRIESGQRSLRPMWVLRFTSPAARVALAASVLLLLCFYGVVRISGPRSGLPEKHAPMTHHAGEEDGSVSAAEKLYELSIPNGTDGVTKSLVKDKSVQPLAADGAAAKADSARSEGEEAVSGVREKAEAITGAISEPAAASAKPQREMFRADAESLPAAMAPTEEARDAIPAQSGAFQVEAPADRRALSPAAQRKSAEKVSVETKMAKLEEIESKQRGTRFNQASGEKVARQPDRPDARLAPMEAPPSSPQTMVLQREIATRVGGGGKEVSDDTYKVRRQDWLEITVRRVSTQSVEAILKRHGAREISVSRAESREMRAAAGLKAGADSTAVVPEIRAVCSRAAVGLIMAELRKSGASVEVFESDALLRTANAETTSKPAASETQTQQTVRLRILFE